VAPSHVEFEITDAGRFSRLVTVFDALKRAKETGEWRDDEYWLRFFDESAKTTFWWPTQEELKYWERRWFSTPVPQRWTDPSLQTPWLFGSMIEAFETGEYELLGCRLISPSRGRIEFEPLAWPFGGTDCMKALIESFGFRVTGEWRT
jgi:hypothetical protein